MISSKLRERYLLEGFNEMQIKQIEDGIEAGLDVAPYSDIRFSWDQMEQIRLGLMKNLDVSIYALPNVPSEEMEHIRQKLEDKTGVIDLHEQEVAHKRLVNTAILIGILVAAGAAVLLFFLFRDRMTLSMEKLDLKLKEDEVTLEYQKPFNAADYIDSYTQKDNVQLKLPSDVDTSALGSQTVTYEITNGVKTVKKDLILNVVDTEPPSLNLNASETVVKAGQTFSCRAYVESASDNHDGDLSDQVSCTSIDPDLEKQKVHYSVSDSSGNTATADLMVIIEPLLQKEEGNIPEETPEASVEPEEENNTQKPEKSEEPKATPASAKTPTPQQSSHQQNSAQPYDETYSFEKDGGTTTCTVHHNADGTTSQSCEWVGPWEEY